MLVSKLYAATMAPGAPEPHAERRAEGRESSHGEGHEPKAAIPPRGGIARLRILRGPRGTTRLSLSR